MRTNGQTFSIWLSSSQTSPAGFEHSLFTFFTICHPVQQRVSLQPCRECCENSENNEKNKNIARDENRGILILHSSNCYCCSGSSDPTGNQQMLSLKATWIVVFFKSERKTGWNGSRHRLSSVGLVCSHPMREINDSMDWTASDDLGRMILAMGLWNEDLMKWGIKG